MVTYSMSKTLTAKIIMSNGTVEESEYSLSSHRFSFIVNEEVNNRLQVRDFLDNGDVLVSYIFDGDYDPRKMIVKKDAPLEITDYFGVKPVKIILQVK